MYRKRRGLVIFEYLVLSLLAAIFLFPMIWMLVSSMKPEADVYTNLTSFKAFLKLE